MCADTTQAGGDHRLLEIRRAHSVEAGGFHFLVSRSRDRPQSTVEVFRQQLAQRVELQTER
jgi:hypothetical protein